ncbi:RNA methyltransferase [Leptolyngbya ohadii]|uniref:RNA methyltransferase n=1 Tax=Leptolyngbya ohadii TaxID=1962290 RepID=UPI000B599DCD|nr:RNA methyltransferase [Leptolyngbya ohadii]
MPNDLSGVRIVLMEPAGSLNVGSVARVMKNMGLRDLVLVSPRCDPLSDEARKMAVHAADVLEAAQQVQTLPEALQHCRRVVATTGRSDTTLRIPLELPRTVLPWLVMSEDDAPAQTALIFGREDRGLTNEELNYAQRLIFIPAHPAYPSLNLAQAVAICCYELAMIKNLGEAAIAPVSPSLPTDLPPFETLEAFYQQLEAFLLKIGYLYPHTAPSRMEKFRRLLHRAYPLTEEVAMLRGILRQAEWALRQQMPPDKR